MASDESFVMDICGQIAEEGGARYRKMFGEYLIYLNEKPIFLICDNTLFVKINAASEALLQGAPTRPPYEGAKDHYVVERTGDSAFLRKLAAALERVTPLPRKKGRKV